MRNLYKAANTWRLFAAFPTGNYTFRNTRFFG
nr:MAG TPA: hypothetical protein [Caudoviricetes sp.]